MAVVLLSILAALNPAPLTFDPAPVQTGATHAYRAARAVKAEARIRAERERRRWRAEQRRIAAERRAEREREARRDAAARAETQAAPSPSRSYGSTVEQWRRLCGTYFPGHVDEALYVVRGESGGNPRASNGICRGLFQIHECHADAFQRVTGLPYFDGVYDPDANARFAAYLSGGGSDWSAWSVRP